MRYCMYGMSEYLTGILLHYSKNREIVELKVPLVFQINGRNGIAIHDNFIYDLSLSVYL